MSGKQAGLKYTSCYLLAAMSGKEVTRNSMTAIFESTGMEFEKEYVDLVLKKMEGKTVQEIMGAGLGNLESCGGGGGGGGGGGAAPAAGGAGGAAPAAAKEEKVEEEEEEMEFDLFD